LYIKTDLFANLLKVYDFYLIKRIGLKSNRSEDSYSISKCYWQVDWRDL